MSIFCAIPENSMTEQIGCCIIDDSYDELEDGGWVRKASYEIAMCVSCRCVSSFTVASPFEEQQLHHI